MKKASVTAIDVMLFGMIILILGFLLYEGVMYSVKKHRENKAIAQLDEVNSTAKFPCDHGTACNFKIHGEHMWCEYHKMYHHRDRACMHNADLEKLEDVLIKDREAELGIVRIPKPVKYKPDVEFNKRP